MIRKVTRQKNGRLRWSEAKLEYETDILQDCTSVDLNSEPETMYLKSSSELFTTFKDLLKIFNAHFTSY